MTKCKTHTCKEKATWLAIDGLDNKIYACDKHYHLIKHLKRLKEVSNK
jgi:hypothetical protein